MVIFCVLNYRQKQKQNKEATLNMYKGGLHVLRVQYTGLVENDEVKG